MSVVDEPVCAQGDATHRRGMIANASRIDAMVAVSAQSGYWAVQGGNEPLKVRAIVTIH